MKKVFNFLLYSALFCVAVYFIGMYSIYNIDKQNEQYKDSVEYKQKYYIITEEDSVGNDSLVCSFLNPEKEALRNSLISEVTKYINKHTKKSNVNLPEHIVSNCLDNNVDICFVLSQTQVETEFGTTGIGHHTSKKSLFGVMNRTYSTYNAAIKDYINILKKGYLVQNKTEHDLLKKYVNYAGYRYAEDLEYEQKLTAAYIKIINNTNIKTLQQKYNKA